MTAWFSHGYYCNTFFTFLLVKTTYNPLFTFNILFLCTSISIIKKIKTNVFTSYICNTCVEAKFVISYNIYKKNVFVNKILFCKLHISKSI